MQFLVRKSVLFAASLGMMCVAVSTAPRMVAQSSTTGAIGGTVSDTGGALLPNTVVTVKSVDTGTTRMVKTTASGDYKVDALQPGVYVVSYTADGFQTRQESNVVVKVGELATVSPKMVVGSVSDKVDVTDQAPDIKTAGADIATTIDQNTIDNLPINGRRYSDFALLTPGVVSNSDGFGLLSFRGISYLLNNVTTDGADSNQAYFSEAIARTRSAYYVSQAAVQEFQVNTSNYSAEYGRAAGGVINTVTKSGSNKTHGEIFFYDRDNGLAGAANPYTQQYNFSEATGLNLQNVKPRDVRLQYGFGAGGAIIKDKLFWFYAFDQQIRNYTGLSRTTDPYDMFALASPTLTGSESCGRISDPYGQYDYGAPTFGYTSPNGTVIPGASVTANLSTPAAAGTAQYPIGQSYEGDYGACALAAAIAPTTAANAALPYQQAAAYYNQGLGVMSTFFGTVPRFGDQTINFPKLDWTVNDKNHVSLQYDRLRWDSPDGIQTQSSNFYGRGSFGNDFVKVDSGIARVSSVLTNTLVNQFTAEYTRDLETEFPSKPTPNEVPLENPLAAGECSAPKGAPGACPAAPPDVSIGYGYDAAGFDIGTSAILSRFALPDERRTQFRDDLTWSHGKQTLKFGLDYNKVSDFINNLYNGYGTYDYDWAYSFIGDYLHATTGLGGVGYAGGGAANGGDFNFGLYSSYSQGYTVPANYNATTQTGTPDNYGASSLMTTREYAGYVTDDWRILERLTMTLGVRYEYQYVPVNPTPNPAFVGDPTTTDGAFFANAGLKIPNTLSRPDDRNNVQPRIGFAWNVTGDSKTVLRGGYGMFFGRIVNATIEQSYQNSGGPRSQVNVSELFSDASTATAGTAANPGVCRIIFPQNVTTYAQAQSCAQQTSNASSHPSISYLDSHLQNPQVHEADLDLQQDFGGGWVGDITYMSSFGRELDSATDVNVNLGTSQTVLFHVVNTPNYAPSRPVALPHGGKPSPIPATMLTVPNLVYTGSRYDPNYYRVLRISSDTNSIYNALAFQLNKRYRNGFSMLMNYTWAHSLDYNPYIGTGIPGDTRLDPNNRRKDYGNSNLDVRGRFVSALTYTTKTGLDGIWKTALDNWRVGAQVQIQTGLPYTPYTSGYPSESKSGVRSANGTGNTSGRIDFLERNQYTDPKTAKFDLRLGKSFPLPIHTTAFDNVRLEFLAEVFNVFNHQNITGVQNTAYNLSAAGGIDYLTLEPNFGTYTNSNSNYTYSPRQLQLAARIHF